MVETELWRPIDGFPGYEVSSFGRVRSWKVAGHPDKVRSAPRIRVPVPYTGGYLRIGFAVDGRYILKLVHRVVLETFVGPAPMSMQGRHMDGDCSNNYASNLEWGTVQQNHDDKKRHGTTARGERQGCAKLTVEQVMEIKVRILAGEWRIGDGVKYAEKFGVSPSAVSLVKKEKFWRHV